MTRPCITMPQLKPIFNTLVLDPNLYSDPVVIYDTNTGTITVVMERRPFMPVELPRTNPPLIRTRALEFPK